MINIEIDASVRERWAGEACLAVVRMSRFARAGGRQDMLDARIESVLSELRAAGRGVFNEPMVQRIRATFRAMSDMDPSRYRPASESLIRRCLEKDLFRISPLVDANNILSVQLRVPLGIYSVGGATGPLWTYRLGHPGETYVTISGQVKSAEGKLVMADAEGVVGSPVADSERAAVREVPNDLMIIAYLPRGTTAAEAEHVAREIEATFRELFEPGEIVASTQA